MGITEMCVINYETSTRLSEFMIPVSMSTAIANFLASCGVATARNSAMSIRNCKPYFEVVTLGPEKAKPTTRMCD